MLLGELLGSKLVGGEVIELASDLGGGKTTFVQGLARGLGSPDIVSSPTFTLKKIYTAYRPEAVQEIRIYHYDFYRLSDPGILRDELAEAIEDKKAITVVEWSDIVQDVLPPDRISIKFDPTRNDPDERLITISYPSSFAGGIKAAQTGWEGIEP